MKNKQKSLLGATNQPAGAENVSLIGRLCCQSWLRNAASAYHARDQKVLTCWHL